jgi:carbonic anhydrase
MTVTDEFLSANADYQNGFNGPLPLPPARKVAVLACMDARLDATQVVSQPRTPCVR